MIRSLFSGLSGIHSHQVQMDTIGNNIANLNTIGYKSQRVSFEDALSLVLTPAQRPNESRGGINPMQVGSGSAVASVDTLFSQGSLERTGKDTDLAIVGDGFFIVRSGNGYYYTRAGAFQFDASGRLINTNGYAVQGKMADSNGNIPQTAELTDIQLPFGLRIPATATSQVTLAGNLSGAEQLKGTITGTKSLLATAVDTEDINGLYAHGNAERFLELIPGLDMLTVDDGTTAHTYIYGTDFTTLGELADKLNQDFSATLSVAVNPETGQIEFTARTDVELTVNSSTNSSLDAAFAEVNGRTLLANQVARSDEFAHIATALDHLADLRNWTGEHLGLGDGTEITLLGATVRGEVLSNQGLLTVSADTTYEEFRAALESALFGADPAMGESVRIQSDGSLQITGALGAENAITDINIGAGDATNGLDSLTVFGNAMTMWESQAAADVQHAVTTTVYDSLGDAHTLRLHFKKTEAEGRWTWNATFDGEETIRGGGSGVVLFNSDGSLRSFEYDDGSTSLRFDPGNGADAVDVRLNVGALDGVDGLTQFAGHSTAVVTDQNGSPLGTLEEIFIDEEGILTGTFSNGVSQTIAKVALAKFSNPSGLLRTEDGLFAESANSGQAIVGDVGTTIQSTIASGALEQSNVDLAQEFTRLIIAQRGFQANSRIITTSDEVLNEVIGLKR